MTTADPFCHSGGFPPVDPLTEPGIPGHRLPPASPLCVRQGCSPAEGQVSAYRFPHLPLHGV